MENSKIENVFILLDGKEKIAFFTSRTLAAEGFKKYAQPIQKSKRLKIKIREFKYEGDLSKVEFFEKYKVNKF